MNRAILAGSVIAGMTLMLMFSSLAPAFATHTGVSAGWSFFKNGVFTGKTLAIASNCTGTDCDLGDLDVKTGDLKKIMKWCGSATYGPISKTSSGTTFGPTCEGNGPWTIKPFVTVTGGHSEPVVITIRAI